MFVYSWINVFWDGFFLVMLMKRLTMKSREWYSPCDDINTFSVVMQAVGNSNNHRYGFQINRKRFEITWKELSARFQNFLRRNMPSWLADYLLSLASFFPGLGRGLKRRTFTCSLCKKPKTKEYGHTMVKSEWYCPSMGRLDEWLRKRTFNFIFCKYVKFYGLRLYVPTKVPTIFYSIEQSCGAVLFSGAPAPAPTLQIFYGSGSGSVSKGN